MKRPNTANTNGFEKAVIALAYAKPLCKLRGREHTLIATLRKALLEHNVTEDFWFVNWRNPEIKP